MTQLERMLGPTLLGRNGAKVATSSMNADVIGLYFSAHWCPPCRQFTPVLVRRYVELKAKRRTFEVVFISSDHEAGSFQEYFSSMPWLSLPYEDRQRKAQLSQMFGVSGIPTLILVDSTGRLLDRNGRQKVFESTFEQQLGVQVDPEMKGETLESIIDVMSTDLTLDTDARLVGYTTVLKIVNNILQNPGDPKYLTLKKNNPAVQAKLANRGFIKILKLAGFEELSDSYKCCECPDTKKLKVSVSGSRCGKWACRIMARHWGWNFSGTSQCE